VQRELRALEAPPAVLLLTARDSTEDKVRGLDLGAADYVTKPFSLDELLARVRSALRTASTLREAREGGAAAAASHDPGAAAGLRLAVHDLELDDAAHEVTRGGRVVQLTPREFELLRYLMRNAGTVVSKAQILDAVWQYDFIGDAGVVETYVSYLRRKLDAGEVKLLHTVRGVGYVVREPRAT
jgi:two-component system OmpR family response regulator